MKLSPEALLEIVDIFRTGLAERKDVSQCLRELDLVEENGSLKLSPGYLIEHPRAEVNLFEDEEE